MMPVQHGDVSHRDPLYDEHNRQIRKSRVQHGTVSTCRSGSLANTELHGIDDCELPAVYYSRGASESLYFTRNRSTFGENNAPGSYTFGRSAIAGPSHSGGVSHDSNEEEINQLLRELECSADNPHAPAVMRDAVMAIETRALANFDPLYRDLFLEQRIRDVLTELSRTSNMTSLLLATHFIDALLPIPYTNPHHKFPRLGRSLSVLLQCGMENPAREAQRIYRRMLELDLRFESNDPPLKHFVPKELKNNCELALMQLHGRVQQSKTPFHAQYLSIMLSSATTVEVNPRYLTGQLRAQIIQVATTLAGSADDVLRNAAYECLESVFRHTSTLRRNEIIIESRRVCDEAVRSLNMGHQNESSTVSSLNSLRALIHSRGLQCIDKQVLSQLCVLVTEQQRLPKSPLLREAICSLVPTVAPVDISSAARRATYCAIIMESVKNIRDERSKVQELRNVAAFIDSVGYNVLDATTRTNLDSILHRYIARPETQEACWSIITAVCTTYQRKAVPLSPSTRSSYTVVNWPNGKRGGGTNESFAQEGRHLQDTTHTPLDAERGPSTSLEVSTTAALRDVREDCINSASDPSLVKGTEVPPCSSPLTKETCKSLYSSHNSSATRSARRHSPTKPAQDSCSGSGQLSTPTTMVHGVEELVRSCVPNIVSGTLSRNLVGCLQSIQERLPTLQTEIQQAVDQLVDVTLKGSVPCASADVGNTGRAPETSTVHTTGVDMGQGSSANQRRATSGTKLIGTQVPVQGTPTHVPDALGQHQMCTPSVSGHSLPAMRSDLIVALDVYSKRPVTSVQQLEDIKINIMPFQRHESPQVRRQCSLTVLTCLSDWIRYAKDQKTSTYSTRVTEILETYVKGVLMEVDPLCRLEEITMLAQASNLRFFLSEPRILSALLSFLNDSYPVREKILELLVAITQDPKQPSSVVAVQQSLYVTVESCVVVLEYTSEVRTLIRSITDLLTFARLCVKPLVNHLGRIFYAFRKRLQEDSVPDVVTLSVLKALDTILAAVGCEDKIIQQFQEDVVDLHESVTKILICSSSPSLSHAAINVLVTMNRRWNLPPVPSYRQHELVAAITHVYIASTCTQGELSAILTLFGQLGAIDPATNPAALQSKKKTEETAIRNEADLELTYDYTVIVYRTLSRMLDAALSETVCTQALRTLVQFVRLTQDKKELVGGVHSVRAVVQVVKRSADSPTLRNEALHVLAAITTMRHERISRVVLPEIVVLLEQLWIPSDHALFRGVLEVVSALKPGKLSAKEQSEYWAWLYPRLVDVALQDRTESREFCLRVVEIILIASYAPPHCTPIVFPMLMQFVQQSDQLVEVRSQSLCAAVHIVCELKAVQYFPSLLHGLRTLTRHCELNEDLGPRLSTPGVKEALKALSALHPSGRSTIKALRERLVDPDELRSSYRVRRAMSSHGTGSTCDAATVVSGGAYLCRSSCEVFSGDDDDVPIRVGIEGSNKVSRVGGDPDISLLMKHIEWGLRIKDGKWREWFAEFQKCIIIVSPHPAFRMIVDLVDKHEPLRRELFHPSFKCLYETLTADQIKKVKDVLTLLLNCEDGEVSSKILGLADYLDHHQPSMRDMVIAQLRSLDMADSRSITYSTDGTAASDAWMQRHGAQYVADGVERTPPREGQAGVCYNNPNTGPNNNSGTPASEETFNFESPNTSQPKESMAAPIRSDMGMDSTVKPQAETSDSIADDQLMIDFQPIYRSLTPSHAKKNRQLTKLELIQQQAHIPFATTVLFSPEHIIKAAERTRMFDKAVSYLENKLHVALRQYRYRNISSEVIQKVVWPLAWLYSNREMHDSVVGLFKVIRYRGEQNDGFGFELLRWWEEAQRAYAMVVRCELPQLTVPSRVVEGYVRTLCFCAEWSKALEVAKKAFRDSTNLSSTVAEGGAISAWMLGQWSDLSEMAEHIAVSERSNTALRFFFINGASLHAAITQNNTGAFDRLRHAITRSKLAVDESLRTMLPLSYAHAYDNLTMLQHFNEMEEIIDYFHNNSPRARVQLLERWNIRFMNLKADSLNPCLRSLMLHSLLLNTSEMSDTILHFCKSLNSQYPRLAEWAMNSLRRGAFPYSNPTQQQDTSPSVTVGYSAHLWSTGRRQEAVSSLVAFLSENGSELQEKDPSLYGTAQLRLGTWKQDLHADVFWKRNYRDEELHHLHQAIRADPHCFEAWHSWGLLNYRIQQRDHTLTAEEQRAFVESAHQGFVGAISRCKSSSDALPGIMRLLQLWVIHKGVSLLKETVADSIFRIPVDHWVQVIPQIIGHLGNESHDIREVISMILRSLCEVHPQAVVFPLLVVIMSDDNTTSPQLRKLEWVQSIIDHCPKRIRNEAETVAKLLVDVSAVPIEKIREHLSQVAAAWNPNAEYVEDPEEVHRNLKSVMDLFHANRKHLLYTVGDIGQFVQLVTEDYRRGNRSKASGIVNQLVDEISKHITEKLGKEPQNAMEPLLRMRNLSVAVFGEYDIQLPGYPTIASFSSKLDVIPSKKRPRRIQLNGSDGRLYTYCLKGNEDIRMDERVMQLFGMVNVLLSHKHTSSGDFIHRFPVIPISSNAGMLGWVENANTINHTICNYRVTISHVRTHQESSVLRSYVESFGHWDKLSVIQRTEVLDFVMGSENCEAVDVSRAMWHRSNTAEQWLARRGAFTTSLAAMSMVGYVMGLGDRHLGNILLSMSTGKVVHIDFGDSFDVGRLRHLLPETIPFRLTRMLTNAMEVFGVNGLFRASATRTQDTLQRNSDSIMALLSAFVYDPIVQHKGKMKNIMEKSRSPQDLAERIRNKLRGMELAVRSNAYIIFNTTPESCRRPDLQYMSKAFDDNAVRVQSRALPPAAQVDFLIDEATRTDNYTTLYFGWGPLW